VPFSSLRLVVSAGALGVLMAGSLSACGSSPQASPGNTASAGNTGSTGNTGGSSGSGTLTQSSAQSELAQLCDSGSSVNVDVGAAATAEDYAPSGTLAAETCDVGAGSVTLYVFDNSADAQSGVGEISNYSTDMVVGSNWVASINPALGSPADAIAQQIQSAFGGTITSGANG
jgi:hypothetical protein